MPYAPSNLSQRLIAEFETHVNHPDASPTFDQPYVWYPNPHMNNLQKEVTEIQKAIIAQNSYNVHFFGAVGDKVADDSKAIEDAIAKAQADGGGFVFVPNKYRITRKIIVPSGVVLVGLSKKISTIFADNCDGIELSGNNTGIRDLTISTNAAGLYTGLKVGNGWVDVYDLRFKGEVEADDWWGKCIHGVGLWYTTFQNIDLFGGQAHTHYRGYGIYFERCTNVDVQSCLFYALNYAVFIKDQNGNASEGITVNQSILITCTYGVYVTSGTFFTVTDNVIDWYIEKGVYLNISGTGNVAGNWFSPHNSTTAPNAIGIDINAGTRITVANNSIGGQGQGIGLRLNGTKCPVIGNSFSSLVTCISGTGSLNSLTGNTFSSYTTKISLTGTGNVEIGSVG